MPKPKFQIPNSNNRNGIRIREHEGEHEDDRIVSEECLREVEEAYADLERELSELGHRCRGCGECCNLVRNKYRLYLSTLELALVLRRTGIERLPPQRAGRCGFQSGSACGIHAVRPLGCRTFFCEAKGMHLQEVYEKYLKRLRRFADKYGVEWNYSQKYPEEERP